MASAAPSTAWFVGALLAGTLAWIAVDFGRGEAPPSILQFVAGVRPKDPVPRRPPIGRGEASPSKRQKVAGGGTH